MQGTGFLGEHADEVYYLPGRRPLPHRHERGRARRLPRRRDPRPVRRARCATPAGPPATAARPARHGKDTRGIIRVHQFNKLEMFVYMRPEDAEAEHARLLGLQEEMLQALGLSYRVIDTAAGDLGSSAARKFDVEAWVPTQDAYRELTVTSNCTTYQARRLDIRYRTESGKTAPVATLNGTLATTRWIVAHPRDAPAGGRLGARARGAAAVPRRPRGAGAGRTHGDSRGTDRCLRWLIALDIDGTVLHEDGALSAAVRRAVRARARRAVTRSCSRPAVSWRRPCAILERLGLSPRVRGLLERRDHAGARPEAAERLPARRTSRPSTRPRCSTTHPRRPPRRAASWSRTRPGSSATRRHSRLDARARQQQVEFDELLRAPGHPRRRDLARSRAGGVPHDRRADGPAPGQLRHRLDGLARHRARRREQGDRARAGARAARHPARRA